MSTLISPMRPGAGTPRRQAAPAINVPNWVKCIPFITVHVVCLAALFTGVSVLALTLLVATYLIKMFGITGGVAGTRQPLYPNPYSDVLGLTLQ